MRSHREHMIDVLFPLSLLLVFLTSAVMVLLLAADIYQETTGRSAQAHTDRTVTAYLTEKIHQNDVEGRVYLDRLEDCPALVLEHMQGEQSYCTYIYCYDGVLRELMAQKGLEVSPDRGQKILELQSLQGEEVKDGLFSFTCTDDSGHTSSVYVAVQSRDAGNAR